MLALTVMSVVFVLAEKIRLGSRFNRLTANERPTGNYGLVVVKVPQ